jgi:hypothetical protein
MEVHKYDVRGDGTIDYFEQYDRNGQGAVAKYMYFENVGDGEPQNVVLYLFDELNRWESLERYEGDVTSPAAIETFLYGENNMIRSWIVDDADDGDVDFVKSFEYDLQNRLEGEIVDSDGDGNPEKWVEYEYGPNGLLALTRITSPPGRVVTIRNRWRDHQLVETERIVDGATVSITHFIYDADGALVEERQDRNADGVVETVWEYEYGEGVAHSRMWVDNALVTEVTVWYGYRGLMARVLIDDHSNGYVRDTVIEYACPGAPDSEPGRPLVQSWLAPSILRNPS